uniref:Uncharacterized protein n=1 Tax=Myripristis murdjan TaxID=586833 RepID=A0A667YYY3_9TELE
MTPSGRWMPSSWFPRNIFKLMKLGKSNTSELFMITLKLHFISTQAESEQFSLFNSFS